MLEKYFTKEEIEIFFSLEDYSSVNKLYYERYKNLGIVPAKEQKIPAIFHHIWITNSNNPKEISESNIKSILKTYSILSTDPVNSWKYNIWSNSLESLPKSREKLKKYNIEFKDIADLDLTESIQENIQFTVDNHYFGMASDFLRYIIIHQQGGLYADLGAELYRAPGEDLYRYDFVANQWQDTLIANNFFAAKPAHLALGYMIEIVSDNLAHFRNRPPKYIYNIKYLTTDLTAEPFNYGFNINLIKNIGNDTATIDVIIPHSKFHNNKNLIFDGIDPEAEQKCDFWDKADGNDICAADELFIGQDALEGETWY